MSKRGAEARKGLYDPRDPAVGRMGRILILLGIVLFAVFSCLALRAADDRRFKSELRSEFLCELAQPCRLEVILGYDKEPVDVNLVSPSGRVYSPLTMDSYEEQEGRLVMSVSTRETGTWNIEYNYKTNRDLTIQTNERYIDQVLLTDVQRYTNSPRPGEPMKYYISVTARFSDGSDKETEVECVIEAVPDGAEPIRLYSGWIALNTQTDLELALDGLPSGEYTLRVRTIGADGYDAGMYSDVYEEALSWENPKER